MSDCLILAYHGVSSDWPSPLAVDPDRLRDQLRRLLRRSYRGVTFQQALAGGRRERRLAVTFDDAFLSVFEHAKPVLDELGIPATVFVPTRLVGTGEPMSWPGIGQWLGGPFTKELVPMSWQQIRTLADAGWEIGSHTRTHPCLPDVPGNGLRDELDGSRADCEQRLGRPCRSIAYPYGEWDTRVAEATRAAGYDLACSMSRRSYQSDPTVWPRVGVYRGNGGAVVRLKVSKIGRRMARVSHPAATGRA